MILQGSFEHVYEMNKASPHFRASEMGVNKKIMVNVAYSISNAPV